MEATLRSTATWRTRLVALVLACAALLQTAATAADGCWSAVFSGRCCCAAPEAAPETPGRARHACCTSASTADDADAAVEAHAAAARGDTTDVGAARVERTRNCGCRFAPLPSTPSQAPVADPRVDAGGARGDFARWIELALPPSAPAHDLLSTARSAPPGGPPRASVHAPAGSSLARTLTARGVLGLLSELCTLRR